MPVGDALWLGLYQSGRVDLGDPASGWDRCVTGDVPSFHNWFAAQTEPNDWYGDEDCVIMHSTGEWADVLCVDSLVNIPAPCLCARSNATATFSQDLTALEARAVGSIREQRTWAAKAFAITVPISLLLSLWRVGRMLGRRGLRRTPQIAPTSSTESSMEPTRPSRTSIGSEAEGAALEIAVLPSSRPGGPMRRSPSILQDLSSRFVFRPARIEEKLRAACDSAATRRMRVSCVMAQVGQIAESCSVRVVIPKHLQSINPYLSNYLSIYPSIYLWQVGWTLVVVGLTPFVVDLRQATQAAIGSNTWWLIMAVPGFNLLLLALFPIDVRPIRIVCATSTLLVFGLSAKTTIVMLAGRDEVANTIASAILTFAAGSALLPTLHCRGPRAMQPRPALRRLWLVARLFAVGLGTSTVAFTTASVVAIPSFSGLPYVPSNFAFSATLLLCAALATPRNRGRLHRKLGRLGESGTEREEAAAVAALVGGADPNVTLQLATRLFRCLPACQLHAADLTDNKTTGGPKGPTLHERTQPATMGNVTAFVSHSWSDEKEAPGAKHKVIARWATRRQKATGKEPTLWLVRYCTRRPFACSSPLGGYSTKTCACTHVVLTAALYAAGQGVHRPGQHRSGARVPARLPRGLPHTACRGWENVLLKAVVRHGSLHLSAHWR